MHGADIGGPIMKHTELPFARGSQRPERESTFVPSSYAAYAALVPAVLLSDVLSIILTSIASGAGYWSARVLVSCLSPSRQFPLGGTT
jgi:hypothetical protein